jgi:hypothetical protein
MPYSAVRNSKGDLFSKRSGMNEWKPVTEDDMHYSNTVRANRHYLKPRLRIIFHLIS